MLAELRAELEALPADAWSDRFDRLAQAEKRAGADERAFIASLREELAGACLETFRRTWGALPLKEGILRLEGKKLRAALTRAAKQARDREVVRTVRSGGVPRPLERGRRFAASLDERAIELPLALAAARLDEPGAVLDAGASLNLPVVRELVPRPAAQVTHFTAAGAPEPDLGGGGYTYAFGDLRAMSYPDDTFDRAVCVSTLEHVGMDNARYGGAAERSPETARDALREILRVLRPGAPLLFTVPYGEAADHGWFRTFDGSALDALVAAVAPNRVATRFFYYDAAWFEGTMEPPRPVLERRYSPDVVTGIAVCHLAKGGLA